MKLSSFRCIFPDLEAVSFVFALIVTEYKCKTTL
jgi:hypothetical protein